MSKSLQFVMILAALIIASVSKSAAATIGLGTTTDTLIDTSNWYSASTPTPYINHAFGNFPNDPLGGADLTVANGGGWPEPEGEKPAIFTYKAADGLQFSKVKMTISCYIDPDPEVIPYNQVGFADSKGARIASTAYEDAYIPSAASYTGLDPEITFNTPPDDGVAFDWYTFELNLPTSATSLIDGHVETFSQISIGWWDLPFVEYQSWANARIGTVELTTVAVPEPASLALLGLSAVMLLRRRR